MVLAICTVNNKLTCYKCLNSRCLQIPASFLFICVFRMGGILRRKALTLSQDLKTVLIDSTGSCSLDYFFLLVFLHVFPHSVHVVSESLLSVRSGVPGSVFQTHHKTQVHIAALSFCILCLQILSPKVILASPPIKYLLGLRPIYLWSKIALQKFLNIPWIETSVIQYII